MNNQADRLVGYVVLYLAGFLTALLAFNLI